MVDSEYSCQKVLSKGGIMDQKVNLRNLVANIIYCPLVREKHIDVDKKQKKRPIWSVFFDVFLIK